MLAASIGVIRPKRIEHAQRGDLVLALLQQGDGQPL